MYKKKSHKCLSLILVLIYVNLNVINGNPNHLQTSSNPCLCHAICQHLVTTNGVGPGPVTSSQSFLYNSSVGSCVQLSSIRCINGTTMTSGCVFSSEAACLAHCGENKAKLGGCKATRFGCCPDGSARPESGVCSKSMDSAGVVPPRNSSPLSHVTGVRWDLVTAGVCLLVMLVALLSIAGILAYNFRHKQRERLRSRYIHNVLEMYDTDSDDSSGSDGDRELKNENNTRDKKLFEKV